MEQALGVSMQSRVVPVVTVIAIVALPSLLGYALHKPKTSNLGLGGRVNTNGTLIAFTNRKDDSITIDDGVIGVPERVVIAPEGTPLGQFTGSLQSAEEIPPFVQGLSRGG